MNYLFTSLIFGYMGVIHADIGSIIGQAIDALTHQPLVSANVVISNTDVISSPSMNLASKSSSVSATFSII